MTSSRIAINSTIRERSRLISSLFFLVLLACLAIAGPLALASPIVPGAKQTKPIAIINGTIHPVTSEPIENGVLLFDQGIIQAIGKDIEIPDDAVSVDVQGKHVYPGLFNAGGQLGLVEIDSIRATDDSTETTSINPNVRAEVAVNPDSELIPVTRSNGVLLTLTVPTGRLIAGSSAVLQLDGWTWEDLTLKSRAGIHINWPRIRAGQEKNSSLELLHQTIEQALAYAKARSANENLYGIDLRMESMVMLLERKVPVVAHADSAAEIKSAIAFCDRYNLRLIIFGGYDAESCAELLKENSVPVVIPRTYRLPQRRSDPFDHAYTLPNRLSQAGVKFCIAGTNRFGASNLRNLAYHAGTAAAYGLPVEEAIKAITIYPAEIFDIASRVGSLEKGKEATLIVTDGNPLDTRTNVQDAYVQGRKLQLDDRHQALWRKYKTKYERLSDLDDGQTLPKKLSH